MFSIDNLTQALGSLILCKFDQFQGIYKIGVKMSRKTKTISFENRIFVFDMTPI